jgi:transcription factor C subunit 7
VDGNAKLELKIYGEPGLGEWFGTAPFDHPSPAPPYVLQRLFPSYDTSYTPMIIPDTRGETIDALHDRTAYALHRIIERCDQEGVKAIVVCTHAATLLALGRALTGRMPRDVGEEDFQAFTAGLSRFERRRAKDDGRSACAEREAQQGQIPLWQGPSHPVPTIAWRDGRGIAGGWDCVLNGDCSFLSGGEERGWRFSGDESFLSSSSRDGNAAGAEVDAGVALGVVVEGRRGRRGRGRGRGKEPRL